MAVRKGRPRRNGVSPVRFLYVMAFPAGLESRPMKSDGDDGRSDRNPKDQLDAKRLANPVILEGTANIAFLEPEREYGPAPFPRHSACTIC